MAIVKKLRKKGIDATMMLDYLTPLSPEFNDLGYTKGDSPTVEKIAEKMIVLQNHPKVSERDIGTIISSTHLCRYVTVSN